MFKKKGACSSPISMIEAIKMFVSYWLYSSLYFKVGFNLIFEATKLKTWQSCAFMSVEPGTLTEGEGSVQLTSLDQLIFLLKIFLTFINKTCYLDKEVNITEPPPLSISWLNRWKCSFNFSNVSKFL